MTRAQLIVVAAAIALLAGLYFGFDTKPADRKAIDQSRNLQGEQTSLESISETALQQLTAGQTAEWKTLSADVESAQSPAAQTEALKKLSGFWYRAGQIALAGGVAEQIAELEQSDSAWSVAGANYFEGLVKSEEPALRAFCAGRAIKAFESAASLRPEQVEHRVNLALVYAENPQPDDPMKAVMMLRDLESKHPEAPSVYNALGRLAIKTGQWQRAIERLEKARSLDPKNPRTPCLLAAAYDGAGQTDMARQWAQRCEGK